MQELDDAQVFLPDVWATHAAYAGDKEAVICGAERLTWGELERELNRTANALRDAGIARGDKVAVLMSMRRELGCDTAIVITGYRHVARHLDTPLIQAGNESNRQQVVKNLNGVRTGT